MKEGDVGVPRQRSVLATWMQSYSRVPFLRERDSGMYLASHNAATE